LSFLPSSPLNWLECQKEPNRWARCLMPVIPATQQAEMERITVWGQPGQKVSKIPSQPIKSWMQWHAPVIPATQRSTNRIAVQAAYP
jgi:hypothetical protein